MQPDPLKPADIHDLIEHLQEGLHFARSIGAKQVTADVEHVELLIDAASRADDGMKDDLDAALDALIRRINGEADLASAAEWVRLNYPGRAKDLRPVAPASGDVRERVLEAIAATQVADLIFLCPGKTFRSLFTRDVTRPLLPRLADAALSALRPGDVVPAGVVTERPRRGGPHPSHSLRSSDASTFDVICTACGHTDVTPGSWGALVDPCPAPPEEGMPA